MPVRRDCGADVKAVNGTEVNDVVIRHAPGATTTFGCARCLVCGKFLFAGQTNVVEGTSAVNGALWLSGY